MHYMWTPTLVATSTSVVVSCAALGLGRPEYTPQERPDPAASSQKRKQPSTPVMPSSSSRLASPIPTSPLGLSGLSSPTELYSDHNLNHTLSAAERSSYDGRLWSGKVRRLTSGDAAAQRRVDHERGSTSGSDGISHAASDAPAGEPPPRSLAVRSRNSWVKRLSSMSTTSNDNRSISSSPSPGSPPVAPSNASVTVSTAGSTIPMLGPNPTAHLPPNKLVKRTSSQRLARGPSSGRIPTLRRPATSHQRSATIQNWTRSQDYNRDSLTHELYQRPRKVSSEAKWKSFFSVKVNKKGAFSRSTDAPTDAQGIKRVIPDLRYYPTLITAKSVVTSTLDVDDFPEDDDDSVFFSSRPPSAFGFESSLASKRLSTSADQLSADPAATPSSLQDDREPSPRRSFSFHDLLSRKPSRKGSLRTPANRLARTTGRRVVSDPTAPGSKHQTIPSSTNSSGPSKTKRSGFPPDTVNYSEANVAKGTVPTLAVSPFTFTAQTHLTAPQIGGDTPNTAQQGSSSAYSELNHTGHSPLLPHQAARRSYHSGAPSERTLSFVDSEVDASPMAHTDEEDGDQGRRTIPSHGRSRGPRAGQSRRGSESRFETIMDESPPKPLKSQLRELLPAGMQIAHGDISLKSSDMVVEEKNMGSPVRTIRSDKADDGSPFASRLLARSPPPQSLHLPSSPPDIAKPLNLGTLAYDDPLMDDDEESRWSCFDEEESVGKSEHEDLNEGTQASTPLASKRSNPFHVEVPPSSKSTTTFDFQVASLDKDLRKDTKSTLFDWSEQPAEKSPGSQSPPRPRTVHGKKDADARGSRSSKRRAPSGLHVRSQSVPVAPDVPGKRQTVITNKFGTWGVGSKGVTEDWDDDFDFGDRAAAEAQADGKTSKRIDSAHPIAIPLKIQEYQANVVSNISLVREFWLMIEELKMLKPRAASLGLVDQGNDLYELVNSMIELADQEADVAEDHHSSSSSPGFDLAEFEDENTASQIKRKPGRSLSGNEKEKHDTVMRTPPPSRPKRKTVLPLENDVFTSPASQAAQSRQATPVHSNVPTRPRKDSEAIARSVIEALKNKKSTTDPSISLQPVPASRRVQFDTRTLRHIVPYVSGLVRKVKEQIRDAERLNTDSESDWDEVDEVDEAHELPLAKIFLDPSESPSSHKPRILRANHSRSNQGSPSIDEVNKKMKMMTVM